MGCTPHIEKEKASETKGVGSLVQDLEGLVQESLPDLYKIEALCEAAMTALEQKNEKADPVTLLMCLEEAASKLHEKLNSTQAVISDLEDKIKP